MSSTVRHHPRFVAVQKSRAKPWTRQDSPALFWSPALHNHWPLCMETSVWLAPNRTFSNWTDRASIDPTLGTWKKATHMKGEKKNLKDWLLRQEASLLQASSQLLWKETATGGTEGTLCSHLGRGTIDQAFSLGFRGRKEMPLSLSRQVYCYVTNISDRCTPPHKPN